MKGISKKIVVISGPSGVGKTTLCNKLIEQEPRLKLCVTATTRPPRTGEVNTRDYYFMSRSQFEASLKKGGIIEYTELFGALYGTPKKSLQNVFKQGHYPLLRIDIQGSRNLKKQGYQGVFIFVLPPDLPTLKKRLKIRRTEGDNLRERLNKAREEINYQNEYDFQVVNDKLDEAASEIRTILDKHLFV